MLNGDEISDEQQLDIATTERLKELGVHELTTSNKFVNRSSDPKFIAATRSLHEQSKAMSEKFTQTDSADQLVTDDKQNDNERIADEPDVLDESTALNQQTVKASEAPASDAQPDVCNVAPALNDAVNTVIADDMVNQFIVSADKNSDQTDSDDAVTAHGSARRELMRKARKVLTDEVPTVPSVSETLSKHVTRSNRYAQLTNAARDSYEQRVAELLNASVHNNERRELLNSVLPRPDDILRLAQAELTVQPETEGFSNNSRQMLLIAQSRVTCASSQELMLRQLKLNGVDLSTETGVNCLCDKLISFINDDVLPHVDEILAEYDKARQESDRMVTLVDDMIEQSRDDYINSFHEWLNQRVNGLAAEYMSINPPPTMSDIKALQQSARDSAARRVYQAEAALLTAREELVMMLLDNDKSLSPVSDHQRTLMSLASMFTPDNETVNTSDDTVNEPEPDVSTEALLNEPDTFTVNEYETDDSADNKHSDDDVEEQVTGDDEQENASDEPKAIVPVEEYDEDNIVLNDGKPVEPIVKRLPAPWDKEQLDDVEEQEEHEQGDDVMLMNDEEPEALQLQAITDASLLDTSESALNLDAVAESHVSEQDDTVTEHDYQADDALVDATAVAAGFDQNDDQAASVNLMPVDNEPHAAPASSSSINDATLSYAQSNEFDVTSPSWSEIQNEPGNVATESFMVKHKRIIMIAAGVALGVSLLAGGFYVTGYVWPGFMNPSAAEIAAKKKADDKAIKHIKQVQGKFRVGDSITVVSDSGSVSATIVSFNRSGCIAEDVSGQEWSLTNQQLENWLKNHKDDFSTREIESHKWPSNISDK